MTARGFRDGDEFDRAEVSDHLLDLAEDRELWEMDRSELLGLGYRSVTDEEARAEWARDRARAGRVWE